MHPSRLRQPAGWGQPPAAWGPSLPGWSPLVDHGPLPLRAASTIARWWWPTVAVAGFLAVVVHVLGHDDPTPGLSDRGLLTLALSAVVVVVVTIRRAAGPGPLARALAEYAVVAVLAVLLATSGAGDVDSQRPAPEAGRAAGTAPDTRPRPIKAVTGAWDWLAELWRQASAEADRHARPPATTTPEPRGEAMPPGPSTSTRRPL
jgi:hypothetical protein